MRSLSVRHGNGVVHHSGEPQETYTLLSCWLTVELARRSFCLLVALFGLPGCANDVLDLFQLAPYRINAVLFFGAYCLLISYLIFRSKFLPRNSGRADGAAGSGWPINNS